MENDAKKPFHIGERLKKHLKDKRVPQANWARAQNIKPRTIAGYYKKETMQLATLFTICQVLKYNFIREIADRLPAEFPPHIANPLEQRIKEMEEEIKLLKKENEVLREVAGMKK